MSATQYPLRKKLEEIEGSNINDIHLRLELIKKVTLCGLFTINIKQ